MFMAFPVKVRCLRWTNLKSDTFVRSGVASGARALFFSQFMWLGLFSVDLFSISASKLEHTLESMT